MAQLKAAIGAKSTDEARVTHIARVLKQERDVDLRLTILEMATHMPGPELGLLLTNLLKTEEDGGVRSQAATALGRLGSAKSLPALAMTAASDPTTSMRVGCIVGALSARHAAMMALAELATRFPELAGEASAKLHALPPVTDVHDREGLADARLQALYQISGDEALLLPFYLRLRSADPQERIRGVTAFRSLKLKSAPPELLAALKDPSAEVLSWTALVLGEISDPQTTDVLMTLAGDPQAARNARCNAIFALGKMKAPAAAPLMEQLLTDADPGVPSIAAIALFRITGKKVKQFPERIPD